MCILLPCGSDLPVPLSVSQGIIDFVCLPLEHCFFCFLHFFTSVSGKLNNHRRVQHTVVSCVQIQQMMKVKSELEDLRQHKSKLQSDLAARVQGEKKVQEQLQALTADKAALQEKVAGLQQAERAAPAGTPAVQADGTKKEKDAADAGYTNTWRLVDQLRTQNRWVSGSEDAVPLLVDQAVTCPHDYAQQWHQSIMAA